MSYVISNMPLPKLNADDDGIERPIENGIVSLVKVLNYLGFETLGSCEGHYNKQEFDDRGKPYLVSFGPWVSIKENEDSNQEYLNILLEDYNSSSPTRWGTERRFNSIEKFFQINLAPEESKIESRDDVMRMKQSTYKLSQSILGDQRKRIQNPERLRKEIATLLQGYRPKSTFSVDNI